MFTGIVQRVGTVERIEPAPHGVRLVVRAPGWEHGHGEGDSISVAGCCLTLVRADAGGLLAFDVVPETLSKTTIGERQVGDRVNLEGSLRAGSLMGGHVVQGHVDGVASVVSAGETGDGGWLLTLGPPPELMDYVVPRGSVAIDGVSMTVARIEGETFTVAVIPTTRRETTLGALGFGDRCNIETDVLVRAVVDLSRRRGGGDA